MASAAVASAAVPLCFAPRSAIAAEPLQGTGLSLPCAVGDVTADGAVVWLRGEAESAAVIEYGKDSSLSEPQKTAAVRLSGDADYTGKVLLSGLDAQKTYFYRAKVANRQPGPIARFVTAPRADKAANVRFAFSGDTRQNFQPFSIMDAIRDKRPDFFMHLGDTIYADREGVARQLGQFRDKYVTNRKDGPTQRLLAETSLIVAWDDHEVADNYRAAHPLAPVGRRAFMEYWPVRQDPADPDRLYRSLRWGSAAELFILDTRQYRDEAAGAILGPRQMKWFVNALASSNARFKFVCTSVPFSSPNADKWGGYPADRDAVLAAIKENQIRGVIFLTADVHYAAVVRVPGAPVLREIITGPLAAPMGKAAGTAKRFEYFNNEVFNYGLVTVIAEGGGPGVEVEILSDKNVLLRKITFDGDGRAQ